MKNAIKYATLLATGRYITCNELPEELTAGPVSAPVNIQLKNESHECEMIKRALQEAGNNKTRAAQLLGIDRKTLYNKLKAYGIAWLIFLQDGVHRVLLNKYDFFCFYGKMSIFAAIIHLIPSVDFKLLQYVR